MKPITDSSVPRLLDPGTFAGPLTDWGEIADAVSGRSRTRGVLIHKGGDGRSECGLWECTPGTWRCVVERDEFCHFLAGRAVYVHESGERIAIGPGACCFFEAGWTGTCEVTQTVRKVYMIR